MNNEIKGFSTYTADVASEKTITADKITSLYGTCLLKESDFDAEGLPCDFRIGEGILTRRAVFSAERLNEHREELDSYIGQLSEIEHAPSFLQLCYNRKGEKWTENSEVVDMLVRMGMAAGMLFLTFPEQLWPYLPNGVPGVGMQLYNVNKGVYGYQPKEYVKMFGDKK